MTRIVQALINEKDCDARDEFDIFVFERVGTE